VVVPSVVLSEGEKLFTDSNLAERFGGLTGHAVLAGATVVADAAAKRALFATTGAQAVDLESGAVARIAMAYGLPFVVVRAICDPAETDLPPAALLALDSSGRIGLTAVLNSVFRGPGQIRGLITLARDAGRARRTLITVSDRFDARSV
jgi:adenosylhomocysteine nucleosidase